MWLGPCCLALCTAGQRVVSKACVTCAVGSTSAAGANPTGTDTTCEAIACTSTGYTGSAGACTCATAAGYSGTVAYSGGATTGCTAIVCTRPSTAGYTFTEVTATIPGFDVTVACAIGFSGSAPTATACTSTGPYSVAGCTAILCTRPLTAGYAFAETTLTIPGFAVTVACSTGYSGGAPTATACTSAGPYLVAGCTAIPCTSTGYTGTAGSCSCAVGYSGTVAYVGNTVSGCAGETTHMIFRCILSHSKGLLHVSVPCSCILRITSFAVTVMNCVAIPCSGTGITGSAGSCICAVGYTGAVAYADGATSGGCTGSSIHSALLTQLVAAS